LLQLGLSNKKKPPGKRTVAATERDLWIRRRNRLFNMSLARLIFIDETSTNTKLTKRTGWYPKGQRYNSRSAHGRPRPSLLACAATA
jgi:hypothetical protein